LRGYAKYYVSTAPLAPTTLVGAHGSTGEDLRRHDTCAPAAMAGSAALPAMGEGHDAAARRARGEGRGRTDEQPCYFGRRADKHTREWKFVLFSLTEMGPFMWSRVRT
jgi:hypothetical protein